MAVCFSQFFSRCLSKHFQVEITVEKVICVTADQQIVLFGMVNDKSVAGLIGLVSAHQPLSHSFHCMCTWPAIAVLSVGAIFVKVMVV